MPFVLISVFLLCLAGLLAWRSLSMMSEAVDLSGPSSLSSTREMALDLEASDERLRARLPSDPDLVDGGACST